MISINVMAQIEIKRNEFPQYQGIVTVNSKPASEIYPQIKSWVAINFKSANDVIQHDDKEKGKLIAKGSVQVNFTFSRKQWPAKVYFTLQVDVKDNRFRYTYDVTEVMDESGARPVSVMKSIINKPDKSTIIEIKENISSNFNAQVRDIQKYINDENSDNW
jgi:hypothetical protein